MKPKHRYYVHKWEGEITRIARLGDDGAYAWKNGKWELMSGLWKIENEVTDYESISEAEAKKLTGEAV